MKLRSITLMAFGLCCTCLGAGVATRAVAAPLTSKQPIYLDCNLTNGASDIVWNVRLDESTNSVSYSIPGVAAASNRPALFSPEKVVFDSIEISRIDLSFKRTANIEGSIKADTGPCHLADLPARQF